MSPEQAGQGGLDIDTRSDIYSLGVLLYELLTGTTPLPKERFQQATYDEIRRIIREEDPPRPSTRLSESKDSLPSLAAQRQTEPAKLTKLVRGELDWIVMKALEKDRNRRYETTSALAADVQRYLNDEPVQACPPSAWYRFRKFARRNKAGLASAALVLAFIVLSGSIVGWGVRDRAARRAEAERERLERQARLTARVEPILADVARLQREQKWPEALAAAQRAEAALAGGEAEEATRQQVRDVLHDLTFVARLDRIRLDRAVVVVVEGKFNHDGAVQDYAQAFRAYGVDVEELPAATAIARLRARAALAVPLTTALYDWVGARQAAFGPAEPGWKPLVTVARGLDADPLRHRLWDSLGQPVTPELQAELRGLAESIDVRAQSPSTLCTLAATLDRVQLADAAVRVLRDGQYAYPRDFWLNAELGSQLARKSDAGAIRYLAVAVSIRPDSVPAHYGLGNTLASHGKPDEAATCYRTIIELDPTFYPGHYGLGTALRVLKKPDEAVACFRKAVALFPNSALCRYGLGAALCDLKELDEAVACFRKAIELDPKWGQPRGWLGFALMNQKKLDEGLASLRKAVELEPTFAAAHDWLGTALENKGLLDEAIAARREAVRLKPSPVGFRALGTTYGAAGQWDKAAAEYDRAVELEPADAHDRYLVAVAHVGAGNVEGYRWVGREMVKRFSDTDQPQAAERTASACLLLPDALDAADSDRVQKLAERAVTGTEKDAYYRYYARAKGLADYRSGRHTEALQWLQRYSPNANRLALGRHRVCRPRHGPTPARPERGSSSRAGPGPGHPGDEDA